MRIKSLKFTPVHIAALWSTIALIFAYRRSMWVDEWNHVQDLKLGLFSATREIFLKPSPFAPGEVWLNWFYKSVLTPFGVPMEIWARAQGVMWGALTVFLCAVLERKESKRLRGLTVLVFFSCSLLSYATEMRPYASLIFSGAVISAIIWTETPSKTLRTFAWIAILFGHIYGVCFIVFILAINSLKRYALEILVGAVVVLGTLLSVKIMPGQGGSPLPSVIDISKQITGTLINPHHAGWVALPFVLIGGRVLFLEINGARTMRMCLLTAMMIFLPIAATIKSQYFFVPRQAAAATVPLLIICCLGLYEVVQKIRNSKQAEFFHWGIALTIGLLPWILTSVLAIPPFSSQPFHRFREVTKQVVQSSYQRIAVIDVCSGGPFEEYYSKAIGSPALSAELIKVGSLPFRRICWKRQPSEQNSRCVFILDDYAYCSRAADSFAENTEGGNAIEAGGFDVIVHGFQTEPEKYWVSAKKPNFLRDW